MKAFGVGLAIASAFAGLVAGFVANSWPSVVGATVFFVIGMALAIKT